MFTLKKHKRKLKMRGRGPYVINEITFGDAVHLETLDGEPMANFINGSCLKQFSWTFNPRNAWEKCMQLKIMEACNKKYEDGGSRGSTTKGGKS